MKKGSFWALLLSSVMLSACLLSSCTQTQSGDGTAIATGETGISASQTEKTQDTKHEEDFKELVALYFDSLLADDYETALSIPYYAPERESERDELREMFETDGHSVVEYHFNQVNKLSDDLYQLDAVYLATYGDEEMFLPFYFYMDGEWHVALNEYEVPEGYLENVEYLQDEDVLDPDGLILYDPIE